MKKLLLVIYVFSYCAFAQDVSMQNGTFNQCMGVFSDSGGQSGLYSNDENFTITFCPTTAGDNVQLDFTVFSTQANVDVLSIYNGPDATFDLIGDFSGGPTSSPGTIQAQLELTPGGIQNPDGCLTVVFVSDAAGNTVGWNADISCFTPCQLITAVLDSTSPALSDPNTVESDLGDTITFNGSGTFSTSGTGATYLWDFGDGNTATGQTVMHTYATVGIYDVNLTITDANSCNSTNRIILQAIVGSSTVGNPNVDAGNDVDICAGECTDLQADFLDIGDTSTYRFEQIPFVPPFAFNGLSNSVNTNIDDSWAQVENLPFDFCFFTNTETQFQVGSNGVIRFDVDAADTGNGYALNAGDNLPNNTNPTLGEANIFSPVHDIDPSVNNTNEIRWEIIGTAPNRVLAVAYFEVPMFSCTTLEATHMAVLYETTNVVDIYVKEKSACTAFNGGRAALGIQNDAGNTAFVPPGRNVDDTPWSTTDEAWRFTPDGPDAYTFEWLDSSGTVVSNSPTFNVCPSVTSTYTARVTYNNCNGDVVVVTDDVTVNVGGANANDITLQQCSTSVNLDAQIPSVLDAGVDASTVTVSFHNFQADADVPQNEITNTTNYIATPGEIIYVAVNQTGTACSDTSTITIQIMPPTIGPANNLEQCDAFPNDGFAVFDLESQDVSLLGGLSAANYNVTYYLSLANATAGTSSLVSPYTNTVNPQPIFVRIEDVNDTACFSVSPIAVFDLVVNPADDPSFTYTATCDGGTVVVSGTPGGVFAFNPDLGDGAVLDTTTGEITSGVPNETYTVEYTTLGTCPSATTETVTVLNSNNTSFNLTATCDGATANIIGDNGGTFSFNPVPTDTAIIDALTGTITNGIQGVTYNVDYSILGSCPSITNVGITVLPLEDASFITTQTCDGATVVITGDIGGTFAFNPLPTDTAVIDPVTGTITSGTPNTTYTIEYTTSGLCPIASTEDVLVFPAEDSSFTYTATCDGGTVVINGTPGGVFAFNPDLGDGAVLDTTTGEITSGVSNETYTVEYTTSGTCPTITTETVTVLPQDDSSFTLTPTCDGAIANITGLTGGVFAFNPDLGDGATIDIVTGLIENGQFGTTYNVDYTTNGSCPTTTNLSITTYVQPTPTLPTSLEVCDDLIPDGFTIIDLNVKNTEITGGNTDYAVTYYLTLMDAENEINPLPIPYTNISNPQTIFSRVEDINTGCYNTVALDLVVEQPPLANVPDALEYCDPDADGFGEFDLQSTAAQITGGVAGLTVTYHETQANAENNVSAIDTTNPYLNIDIDNQIIYVRIESTTIATDCASFVDLQLIVYPSPQILDDVTDLAICDDATADGFTVIDLTVNEGLILNGLPASDYSITYYETEANANTAISAIVPATAYTNSVANNHIVWVRVEDNPTVTATGDGCYTVVAMNIIVNPLPVLVQPDELNLCDYTNPGDQVEEFDLTLAESQILAGQNGISLSYHETQSDADANVSALPTNYENVANAQTIYVRAENDATGCVSTITLTLRVNPLPSPLSSPVPLVACDIENDGIYDDFDLDSQTVSITNGEPDITITYHETEQNAIDGSFDLVSPYINIVPFSQLLWVRAENDITGCYTIVNLELQVIDSPVIPIDIDPIDVSLGDNTYVVCDDDNDGFNSFDFDTAVTPVVLGSQSAVDYPISYYLTEANAEAGTNAIINTGNYTNISNPQTVWVKLDSPNGCTMIRSFDIRVEFPPVLVTPPVLEVCDDLDSDYYEANDGITSMDLTVRDSDIIGANASWIVSYYVDQIDAESGTNPIPDASMFENTVSAAQTIWVRVVDSSTGCYSVTTLTVRVTPNPSPSQDPDDIELCDYDASPDGIEVFDLTVNELYILNGEGTPADPRHVSYYTDLDDAIAGTNFIVDPTMHSNTVSPETIYVRVTNGTDIGMIGGTGCFTIVSFDIIVNPLPIVPAENLDIEACELGTTGFYNFDLTVNTATILAAQTGSNYTVTYHEQLADAEAGTPMIGTPDNYLSIANPQPIYVAITNTITGCITTLSFSIEVNEAALAYAYADAYEVCDDNMEFDGNPNNDSTTFDLSTQDEEVLGGPVPVGQDPTDYIVSYYESQADAEAGVPGTELPTMYTNTSNPQIIYVRVDNNTLDGLGDDSSFCYAITPLTLQVNPLPAFDLDDNYVICANTNGTEVVSSPTITTGLSATDYSFVWTGPNGVMSETGPSIVPTEGGNYTVEVTDISTSALTMCSSSDTTLVEISQPPVILATVTTDAFADTHNIEVTTTPNGTVSTYDVSVYEFSLDGGAFVSNTPDDNMYLFTDVGAGEHVITVRDKNGCGEATTTVMVMDYPLYFTPNGDGYNDTWNIYGIQDQPDATIYIFDRMGKLLKQISPTGQGWDGTYNGELMPTSDYWFTVEYREPNSGSNDKKQFKAHFALKR